MTRETAIEAALHLQRDAGLSYYVSHAILFILCMFRGVGLPNLWWVGAFLNVFKVSPGCPVVWGHFV